MFDHRLGLALGKSVGEIHRMPINEYHDWELFYMLEPWGWHNEEYLTSMIVAMIHNIQVKSKDQKKQSYFMRDMQNIILSKLDTPDLSNMSEEEINELKKKLAKEAFGIK